jgi:hypothetical protein
LETEDALETGDALETEYDNGYNAGYGNGSNAGTFFANNAATLFETTLAEDLLPFTTLRFRLANTGKPLKKDIVKQK